MQLRLTTVSNIKERRQRIEVSRNRAALIEAAIEVLSSSPDAGMDDIAAAAGVTRQTAYAHFGSRDGLLQAVVDELTQRTLTLFDQAKLDDGSATDALHRFIDTSWQIMARFPALLEIGATRDDHQRHRPVHDLLEKLISRGMKAGEFDAELDVDWLVAATVAIGHAAGEEVRVGRMEADRAPELVINALLRLYGAPLSKLGRPVRRLSVAIDTDRSNS